MIDITRGLGGTRFRLAHIGRKGSIEYLNQTSKCKRLKIDTSNTILIGSKYIRSMNTILQKTLLASDDCSSPPDPVQKE